MKIVVIAGTGSGCGKTTLGCAIVRAIPRLGAVKISPREVPLRIEWGPGSPGKDTALYAAAGASPVARIVGQRDEVAAAWGEIRGEFASCSGVLVEGASALGFPEERLSVFVRGVNDALEGKNGDLGATCTIRFDRQSHGDEEALIAAVAAFLG